MQAKFTRMCVRSVQWVHISPPRLRCRGLPTLTLFTLRRASTALPRCQTTTLSLSFFLLTHTQTQPDWPTCRRYIFDGCGVQTPHLSAFLLTALLGLTVVARQQCFQWFALFFLLHSLVDMSKFLWEDLVIFGFCIFIWFHCQTLKGFACRICTRCVLYFLLFFVIFAANVLHCLLVRTVSPSLY